MRVLAVCELWQTLEHFNLSGRLDRRIVRGRREDAEALLATFATSVRFSLTHVLSDTVEIN